MKHLLSLCMIVKDEEKVIQRCLDSVQGLVDEIIIVDTGSTDRTKEIARSFTDNIYDFQWINDFSAARNKSLNRATCKWILLLDADEYIDNDSHQQIINFLQEKDHTQPQGFILPIINHTGYENSGNLVETFAVRIISNHPDINFYRPIHEQIQYKYGELSTQRINFNIFHTGYTHETTISKDKRTRNLTIFNEMKKNRRFEEYDFFSLANEYDSLGDYKKALYYYKRADTKKSQNSSFIIHCKYKIVTTLAYLGKTKEAFEVNDECIQRWPQIIDFRYLKAHYLQVLGFTSEATQILEQCITIAEKQSKQDQNFWFIAPNFTLSVYNLLIDIYSQAHNNERVVTLITHLINTKSERLKDLALLMQLLIQFDDIPIVTAFLDKLYNSANENSTLRLLQASLIVGHPLLVEHYYNKCSGLNIERIYKLHYSIITDHKELFIKELSKKDTSGVENINRIIGLGLCLWKDSSILNYLEITEDDDEMKIVGTLNQLLNQNSIDSFSNVDINLIYHILVDLFNSEHFSAYDWLISKFPEQTVPLTNLLGDYFYSKQKIELAFDYYSMLLDKRQLSAIGCENVAQYYMNSGNTSDALEFIKMSLDQDPHRLHLYTKLLSNTTDKEDKLKYSKLFNHYYPQYQGIPLVWEIMA